MNSSIDPGIDKKTAQAMLDKLNSSYSIEQIKGKVAILRIHREMVDYYSDISRACLYVDIRVTFGKRKEIEENPYSYDFSKG